VPIDDFDLTAIDLAELAESELVAPLAGRLTRLPAPSQEGADPVRVAAFNSYI
jgi:hypothetical protein